MRFKTLTRISALQLSLFFVIVSQLSAQDASYYHQKGLDLWKTKDYNGAIKMWMKEIELNPKSAWAYFDIGVAYEDMQNYTEAMNWKKKALDLEPNSGRFHRGVGISYYSRAFNWDDMTLASGADLQQAIQYFEKAMDLGDKTPDVFSRLLTCYRYVNVRDKANRVLLEWLKVEPFNEGLLSTIRNGGYSDITEDTIKKYQEEFRKREEEKQKKREARIRQLQKEGRLKDVEPYKESPMELLVRYASVGAILIVLLIVLFSKPWLQYYQYLGNKYYQNNDFEKAAKYYEKLLQVQGRRFVPYDKLKTIYLKTGRKDALAVRVFEKLYEDNPEDKDIILALADIYSRQTRE